MCLIISAISHYFLSLGDFKQIEKDMYSDKTMTINVYLMAILDN